ncbi:C1 family peptidase [Ligilactobacillus pobuzihii]|uniref:Aminopeptidase n=1 Tax=Ligilactobacillus pobuzihii TaxID=449659 RepID=A0A0R2LMB9_9LACO|nr:C1 family peptidase [Ligilactobacillus pobuzihii]KRK10915.1 aminopeptidase [Ligilactobacillus pobuzihii E100301 = KCTC 13174]KRN99460.1 aminopeptidase [Ligilactobacillus pobuzihii]GEN49202.1 aminopeptidase C [Ligilactobacillus pobuzihii]
MTKDLTAKDLQQFKENLTKVPASQVLARTVQQNGVLKASADHDFLQGLNRTFSVEVETDSVTNQKQSGRCWLFATLNTLRHDFAKKYKVKDFQFSQNYNSFYDRLEKANKMLEWAIELVDRPADDREYIAMLEWGDDDGGQWANGAALINKYGVVPQSVMPETYNSEKTKEISDVLNYKLKNDVVDLRASYQAGVGEDELRQSKKEMISEVYRMLVYAFGQPPEKFDFEYRDDDKKYHLDRDLTPQEFFQKYVAVDFDQYAVVADAPDHESGKNYVLTSQNYIFDGKAVELANVGLKSIKDAAIASLKNGKTVWFGCDVGHYSDRQQGILATEYFQKADLFNIDLTLDKAQRLATREGECSHAMTLTGVDIVEGQPTKWKVENSWGDKVGEKGYFIMSDEWFDQYVYEVVVDRKYLTEADLKVVDSPAEELEPWDSLS